MAALDSTILNGVRLRREFLHVAKLAHQAHGVVCDPEHSVKVNGIWRVRDKAGRTLCEIDALSGSVCLIEDLNTLPPEGLVDRIADLRRCGLSSVVIHSYLSHMARSRDPMQEAALVLQTAARIISDVHRHRSPMEPIVPMLSIRWQRD